MFFRLNLARNDRGAVMIMTIFMLLFLIAMLYVVIGIGKTLIMREGMQDAADAAAYSSAIFNARGMNLIVFINLLMAALVAILVALRMAQTLLYIGSAIAAGLAWSSFGATGPLAAQLAHAGKNVGDQYRNARDAIEPVLEGLHTTQEAVSVVVPWVAMTQGMLEASQHHAPAQGAFAIPGSTSLPVEVDEFSKLCGKASETAVSVAFAPMPNVVDPVREQLEIAASKIGESTSKFLCGDGSGSPPTHTETVERQLPRHPHEAACTDDPSSPLCDEIKEDLDAATPDPVDGECQEDCGHYGAYESQARRARDVCESMPGFVPTKFVWQHCLTNVKFLFNGAEWEEASRGRSECQLKKTSAPPCGHRGIVNDESWNRESGPESARVPDAVCRRSVDELLKAGSPGESLSVEVEEALRIFSCVTISDRTFDLAESDDALGGKRAAKKSPHRIEDDVDLGDETFQIRAVAFGAKPGPKTAREGVEVVLRGKKAGGSQEGFGATVAEYGAELGRLSVAQSEYYFDHRGDVHRDEWMWEMRWTARLKHFHLPSEEEQRKQEERQDRTMESVRHRTARHGGMDPSQTAVDSCSKQGGSDCGGAVRSMSLFDSLVRH